MTNQITQHNSNLFVELTNVEPHVFFTGSLEDQPMIESHRWRYINEQVVTTVIGDGMEMRATIESLMCDADRKTVMIHRNGNRLDYTRENLTFMVRASKQNTIVRSGDAALVLLPNAQTATIDLEDINKVRPYYFRFWYDKGRQRGIIYAHLHDSSGNTVRRTLARCVLNLNPKDSRTIVHLNGDTFDCRKSNLRIGGNTLGVTS